MMTRPIEDEDLHAFVDGQLDPERRTEVQAFLAENPKAAERVEDYRGQAAMLHALFDPVLEEPPTAAIEALTAGLAVRLGDRRVRRPRAWAQPLARVAAALLLMAVGLGGGYLLHSRAGGDRPGQSGGLRTFAEEAAQAHAFYASDQQFPAQTAAQDRGALDGWLSQRLGRRVFAPDLSRAGYQLVGGHPLPTPYGAGAQYLYENGAKQRLTLFVSAVPSAQEAQSFSFVQQGNDAMLYWLEGSLGYALIGQMNRDQLMGISQLAYNALKKAPSPAPQPASPQGGAVQPVAQPTVQGKAM